MIKICQIVMFSGSGDFSPTQSYAFVEVLYDFISDFRVNGKYGGLKT